MSETEVFIREMMVIVIFLIFAVGWGIILKGTFESFDDGKDKPNSEKRSKNRSKKQPGK